MFNGLVLPIKNAMRNLHRFFMAFLCMISENVYKYYSRAYLQL